MRVTTQRRTTDTSQQNGHTPNSANASARQLTTKCTPQHSALSTQQLTAGLMKTRSGTFSIVQQGIPNTSRFLLPQ
eukprot:scaffold136001_cov31-Tisochrysis_lutea.AAC.1